MKRKNTKKYIQSFSNKKTEYQLSKDGKSLVVKDTIDLQELINSNADVALSNVYLKFTEKDIQDMNRDNLGDQNILFEVPERQNLVDSLNTMYQKQQDIKERYGINIQGFSEKDIRFYAEQIANKYPIKQEKENIKEKVEGVQNEQNKTQNEQA